MIHSLFFGLIVGSVNHVQEQLDEMLKRRSDREAILDRASELCPTNCSDNDEEDSPSPLIDLFAQEGGRKMYKGFTPFSKSEYERLWDLICVDFCSRWSNASGPQCKTNPKDALFIALSVLHLPTKWGNHGITFRMTAQTCEKTVWKALCIAGPILKAEFVRNVLIDDFNSAGIKPFVNYPIAHHATDASVTQFNRPTGSHLEAKGWFSNKHKLYCGKVETSVYPNGEACNWTKSYPGAVPDITIMRDNIKFLRKSTRKSPSCLAIVDHGENASEHPRSHAIILDKGYVGIGDLVR